MALKPGPAKTVALLQRIRELEAMVQERDDTLEAVQRGDIDALVRTGHPDHFHLYTLGKAQPYRVLIEEIQEAVVILGENGEVRYCNLRLANMLGIPHERIIGQKLQPFLAPDGVAAFEQMLNAATLVSTRGELTLCPADREPAAMRFSLNYLCNDNASRLLCGIITDFSQQKYHIEKLAEANADLEQLAEDLKRAQAQAERANEAKSRFLAGMTHELRTPLHGILGYAELLSLEGGLSPLQSERLEVMMAAGQHLLNMIDAVLDMSQIEADHPMLNPAEIQLLDLARICLDVVRPAAEAKGLALRLAPAAPHRLFADPTRLRQVLINLLGNAVKFTPSGSVEVRMREIEAGTWVRLEVADTGPGIWARHRDKLFQTFERLNANAVAGIEGAGLGLAIAHRLLQAMGGRIGYYDNPGGGSVFWVELPVLSGLPAEAVSATPSQRADGPRLRLLVADDEALNRNIASGFLTSAGHQVVCVNNGAAAVAAAASGDFDAILMDIRMPGMNGLEATRQIRMLPAPRGDVRVVAVTAHAFAQQIEVCWQAGLNSHVSKPFTRSALLAAVEEPMSGQRGIAAPAAPQISERPAADREPSVLDRAMFAEVAESLSTAELRKNLKILITRSETMLHRLRRPSLLAQSSRLADAAHKLAGGAGTFGFLTVAAAARRFEVEANTNATATALFAEQLAVAITASITMVRQELAAITALAA